MAHPKWHLPEDRYFSPASSQRQVALELYSAVADLPLISPHGHVDPALLSDATRSLGTPTELFIIPDHYIFRMLYSQGIPLESLGIPRVDGGTVEQDHRKIWQLFADNFYLFRGTPTGAWLAHELGIVFGIETKLTSETAQAIYDELEAKLAQPEFRPRAMFERFNLETLCTTDAATDRLTHHQAIRDSGWQGSIRPTYRPDAVVNLDAPNWRAAIDTLSDVSGISVDSYPRFIQALEQRRAFFKDLGAKATDHAAVTPYTAELSAADADQLFHRALRGQASADDARRFTAHMLMEMARMSVEDGLVMQLHPGSIRDHNALVYRRHGKDMGGDIPQATEFTHNLRPLLNKYGVDSRLRFIVFMLDESTQARELAPLAGHYPAMFLGPPWWFHDSINGMRRFFDRVIETAGLYNTTGFNDDTRAFASIAARHDLWRRVAVDWVAGQLVQGIIDEDDAHAMAHDLAYGLVKRAYRLDGD